MKKIITLLLLVFALSSTINAQTITKTASKSSVYIGEEFYYTITIENLNSIRDLDKVIDKLGPEIDYIGVELSPSILLLQNWGFCNNIQDSFDTVNHVFTLDFTNCSGSVMSINSFSFKLKVKLNDKACQATEYKNSADLILNNNPRIQSNSEVVSINQDHPYKIQKTFRRYDNTTRELVYDVRLSSSTRNFNLIDFNSNPKFSDSFTVPSCFTITPNAVANSSVTLVNNSSSTPINSSALVSGSSLNIDWQLPAWSRSLTNILFQVRIKVDSCTCATSLFTMSNAVGFKAKNICGDILGMEAQSDIPNVGCTNTDPNIPTPVKDSILVSKTVELDDNNLNLTMKGCTGKYVITVQNSSRRLNYRNFNLTDAIPNELDLGMISVTGNATHNLTNNNLTVNNFTGMRPNDVVTVTIPFEVNTPIPSLPIKNCASITVNGDDGNSRFTLNRNNICAPTITTVPNQVALHTSKYKCSKSYNQCGPFSSSDNLPGDEVEYALHFYNYGTVEAIDVNVTDKLPEYFKIQDLNRDVRVYKKSSGDWQKPKTDICGLNGFREITGSTSKGYDVVTNELKIKLNNEKLDAFTCRGIEHFVVKVKVKIDDDAPNDVYKNQFVVEYNDPSTRPLTTGVLASNEVDNTVNIDQLVLGYKKRVGGPYRVCKNKRATYQYEIALANMGTMPITADINDVITLPPNVSIVPNTITGFSICRTTNPNPNSIPPCTPVFTNSIPTMLNSNGFFIRNLNLDPCEITVIRYMVTYDTNLLSRNETVQVCNEATVKAYLPDSKKAVTVVTGNESLIYNYVNAKTKEEQLEAIALIKEVKQNPEILNNTSKEKFTNKSNLNHTNIDYGKDVLGSCVDVSDCLKGSASGCLTSKTTPFNFSITGMNAQGEITTSLSNLPQNKKVTKIEYLLTDVRVVKPCKPKRFWWRGRSWRHCIGTCSKNVVGSFTTTNTSPINGSLNFLSINTRTGTYNELNKLEFSGNPTILTQDNRTFKFPVSINCNGTYEFTITAIVHFEDCSVCYVTDVYDYNATWRPIFVPRGGGISLPPFTRI